MKKIFYKVVIVFFLLSCTDNISSQKSTELQNPIIPGYFADPSLVQHDGKFYLYATVDPWGGDFLACWESSDFQNWTFHKLNWPTKEACISPLSNSSMVWAPSIVKKNDLFYMYVSVGSEVWCGVARHPMGPWSDMLAGKPLIERDTTGYYHAIDAEAFINDDGKPYLYWGSGLNWINGHCFAAELNDDMYSFKTVPQEITPSHFFEGPLMLKRNNKYYLTYSEGKTLDETYEVRYAVSDSPFGPFTEASNSPILAMNDSLQVYGPGHHTLFSYQGKDYILYHRHSLPFAKNTALRQICINEMKFDETNAQIKTIVPNHKQLFPSLETNKKRFIIPQSVEASSKQSEARTAKYVLDNSYATRWEASDSDSRPYITSTFSDKMHINTMEIRFEYPWKTYRMKVESSDDGTNWSNVVDYSQNGISGSPVIVKVNSQCRKIRIVFNKWDKNNKPSIWELRFL